MPSEEIKPTIQVPSEKKSVIMESIREKQSKIFKARLEHMNPDLNIKSKLSSLNLKKYVKDE